MALMLGARMSGRLYPKEMDIAGDSTLRVLRRVVTGHRGSQTISFHAFQALA
jgi:hypothetical protein